MPSSENELPRAQFVRDISGFARHVGLKNDASTSSHKERPANTFENFVPTRSPSTPCLIRRVNPRC
jgi:hypothetical protein